MKKIGLVIFCVIIANIYSNFISNALWEKQSTGKIEDLAILAKNNILAVSDRGFLVKMDKFSGNTLLSKNYNTPHKLSLVTSQNCIIFLISRLLINKSFN